MRLRKKNAYDVGGCKKSRGFAINSIIGNEWEGGRPYTCGNKRTHFNASKELGYSVNKLASALNGTGSGMIGVLTDDLVSANFAGDLIKGAQNKAWENDKLLVITALDEHESKTKKQWIT